MNTLFSTEGPVPLQLLTTDHLSKELFRGVSEERNAPHEELVEDDPHGPPVYRLPVALPQYHLWGDVLRRTTHLHKTHGVRCRTWQRVGE